MDYGSPRNASIPIELVAGTTAMSYLEGYPLSILDPEALHGPAVEAIRNLPGNFDEFCGCVANEPQTWRKRFADLSTALFVVGWCNSAPFIRLLRDYRFWRWFEIKLILTLTDSYHTRTLVNDQFSPIQIEYVLGARDGKPLVLIGPVVRTPAINHIALVRESLVKFQSTIKRYWEPSGDLYTSQFSELHSTEKLIRYLGMRLELAQSWNDGRVEKLVEAIGALRGALLPLKDTVSITRIGEVCVLMSIIDDYADDREVSNTLKNYLERKLHSISEKSWNLSSEELFTALGKHRVDEVALLVSDRQTRGLLFWTKYFNESLSILDDWLPRSIYLSLAPRAFEGDTKHLIDWDRVCQFLCTLFVSSEVTIYRYSLTEPNAPLSARGVYCGDLEKCSVKREFMGSAASNPDKRRRSASYRAADLNMAQYVPDALAAGAARSILVPESTKWENWGRSVLAIPIRINGGVWGVLEFVSSMPHHYGSLLRSQCEEAASALSTTFLSLGVLEVVSSLDNYWTDNFGARFGRRTELCREISNLFGSDLIAIYTASFDAQHGHYDVVEFGSWSNVAPDDAAPSAAGSIARIRDFLDSNERVRELEQAGRAGQTALDAGRRSFLARLNHVGTTGPTGALLFSTPRTIITDFQWERNTYALAQMIGGLILSLTSDASWEQEVKVVLRHEYNRIKNSVESIVERLQQRIVRRLSSEDKHVGEQIVRDLSDAVSSLAQMSETLLYASSVTRALNEDPRLIVVKRAKEVFNPSLNVPVRLRDLFFRKFLAMGNRKGLKVNFSNTGQEFFVCMDENTLSDILGTLSDNAVKYSVPNSEIIMTMTRTPGGRATMTIANLGPRLESHEEEMVFADGFRGEYAREEFPNFGSGKGLGFAQKAIELWNGTLSYRQTEPQSGLSQFKGRPVVWHRFTLTFPPAILSSHSEGGAA